MAYPSWWPRRACAGLFGLFYSPPNEPDNRTVALAICAGCPVLPECRTWIATEREPIVDHVIAGMRPREVASWRALPQHVEWRRFHHRPPCGSEKAYTAHLRYGEHCARCTEAHSGRVRFREVAHA